MGAKQNLKKKLEVLKKELLNKKAEAFDIILKNDIVGEDNVRKNILELELELENTTLELEIIENNEMKILIKKFYNLHINTNDIQIFLPVIKLFSVKKFTASEKKEVIKKVVDFINSISF